MSQLQDPSGVYFVGTVTKLQEPKLDNNGKRKRGFALEVASKDKTKNYWVNMGEYLVDNLTFMRDGIRVLVMGYPSIYSKKVGGGFSDSFSVFAQSIMPLAPEGADQPTGAPPQQNTLSQPPQQPPGNNPIPDPYDATRAAVPAAPAYDPHDDIPF